MGAGNRQRRGAWRAAAVHAFTASGAVLAFLAALAAAAADPRAAFLWLLGAVAVDAADGWLARLARVAERLPRVSGARLDDLVDYLTYVFVPMSIVWYAGLLPPAWAPGVVAAVLVASAVGFARDDAKTADHFFTGFPSYWNVVALYLVVGGLPPAVNAGVLVGLAALVFAPVRFVYPTRTPTLRGLTLALGAAWGAVILLIVVALPDPPRWLVWVSLAYPAYYAVLSLVLDARRAG